VWRFLSAGTLALTLGFAVACGDDEGAIPTPGPGDGQGTITGRVTNSVDGSGIVGATVGTNPATTVALTDANGNYTIQNVEAGSYAVIAQKAGFNEAVGTANVTDGGTATVNLALTPLDGGVDDNGNVTGLVRRGNGQAVPEGTEVDIFLDASVCDETATPTVTETTDAGGRYVSTDLAEGNYLACVNVTIGGQEFTGRTGFVINAGETSQADITVSRDADQTTDPNIGGEPIDLDENGNFEGSISFVDVDGDGDDDEDCNVIRTQHLWVVEVTDGAGTPVSGVRVEWSLNDAGGGVLVTGPDGETFVRGTTGVIVDTDDPFLDPVQAESAKRAASGVSPQFKVDDHHAVTYTNDSDQTIDFDGESVTIAAGQTWIIVTSPQEGFTDVIAFSPDLARSTPNADKAFAIKRWVNWRIEVAELSLADTTGGVLPGTLEADVVAEGDTITNRLDRTPQFAGADCALAADGTICDLSNRAFIGIVLSRFRLDSPFTFISGNVAFEITDDSPDADLDDIDSDEELGGVLFTPGGFVDPVTENFGDADFAMDEEVSFECEEDPANFGECLDIDVVIGLNSVGQSLSDMGFTISSAAEVSAVAVTVSLDSLIFFATADTSQVGFSFSEDLQALIEGRADLDNEFTITITDEFGEVCDEIVVTKRWISSVLRIFKQGPATVSLGDLVEYTVTVVNDGEDRSTDVIIADTLPILDEPEDGIPGDRNGNQAFSYVTDDPTFDPAGIRYYIDVGDDEPGTTTDVCLEAPTPLPVAFPTPALCPAVLPFATIADARAAAEDASQTSGDQVVIVEYYDVDILARTDPGGPIEAEDSFEITVEAIHSVNEFGPPIPAREDENGEWCNIATVTSAENDFAADSVCTRVVEALLEVRKTATDALVPAGGETSFTVEIANNGSEDLVNLTVADTLDAAFLGLNDTVNQPGLVLVDFAGADCPDEATCPFTVDTTDAGQTVITFTVPSVPPTDDNGNGVFDDDEGFLVATIQVRTPLAGGTFCNRVTVSDEDGRSDTDLACVVTQVEIEFDITNEDGIINPSGDFENVETFEVGDTIQYRTTITNRSDVAATNVQVLWEIAPDSGIIEFLEITLEDPADISCSTTTDTCSVTVASLAPDESIALNYNTLANFTGNDVNRITLEANELSLPVVNEEPTTVNP
jgi:uncharacterized repeat protein (TIGR01451 family)